MEPSRFAEQLSPCGGKVAYLGPDDRADMHLWLVDVERPENPERISPANGESVRCFFWMDDKGLLWQSSEPGGRPRLYFKDLTSGGIREILADENRVIRLAGVVGSGESSLLLGISESPTPFPDLYTLPLAEGSQPSLVFTNESQIIIWSLDASARPAAGLRWTHCGGREILDLRNGKARVAYRVPGGDDLRLLASSGDGRHAWIITNKDSNLTRMARLDLENGICEPVASDPQQRVDVENVILDPLSSSPLAVCYSDESMRWQALDPAFGEMQQQLQEKAAASELLSAGYSRDRKRWLLSLRRAGTPATVWLFDSETNNLRRLWDERPDIDVSGLCETKAVRFAARDGKEIPGFLTVPRTGAAPWPTVVFPHGGPNMRTTAGFDGRVQFLASRGYAVLQPNFRGSRGYGKDYMNAGDRQWGRGVMQTDVSDGVAWLVMSGVADPQRVAILGGSYGGYAALAGLAFTPELYAAGVCLFGISDLPDYAQNHSLETQAAAGDTRRRIGDPSTATGREILSDLSPVNHAAAFQAPLLLYHGMKDTLIPVPHATRMAEALKCHGKEVDLLLANDEDHGFANPESEMAVYRAIEFFLHEHLGGSVGPIPSPSVNRTLQGFSQAGKANLVTQPSQIEGLTHGNFPGEIPKSATNKK